SHPPADNSFCTRSPVRTSSSSHRCTIFRQSCSGRSANRHCSYCRRHFHRQSSCNRMRSRLPNRTFETWRCTAVPTSIRGRCH
ncbi:hypothetical protein PFISCL1PPCAC_16946, partial [Pristionchus fissidentatus]